MDKVMKEPVEQPRPLQPHEPDPLKDPKEPL